MSVNSNYRYLEEQAIASLLFNGSLNSQRVCHSQIVTDNLDAALLSEVGPCFPIILVKRIFDRDNGIVLDVAQVEVSQLNTTDPFTRI